MRKESNKPRLHQQQSSFGFEGSHSSRKCHKYFYTVFQRYSTQVHKRVIVVSFLRNKCLLYTLKVHPIGKPLDMMFKAWTNRWICHSAKKKRIKKKKRKKKKKKRKRKKRNLAVCQYVLREKCPFAACQYLICLGSDLCVKSPVKEKPNICAVVGWHPISFSDLFSQRRWCNVLLC